MGFINGVMCLIVREIIEFENGVGIKYKRQIAEILGCFAGRNGQVAGRKVRGSELERFL